MSRSSLLPTIAFASAFFSASQANAALSITLHPDGSGGTVVAVAGSGVTGSSHTSQLTNGITFGEQWLGLTGNPFSDTFDPSDSDHMFTTPIPITNTVSIIGIQVDNDSTGDNQDDFRIYVDGVMSLNEPYSASGVTTLTTTLPYEWLTVGTFTDDTDGGTTYLGGFSLEISDQVLVPEPASVGLLGLSALMVVARRRRH